MRKTSLRAVGAVLALAFSPGCYLAHELGDGLAAVDGSFRPRDGGIATRDGSIAPADAFFGLDAFVGRDAQLPDAAPLPDDEPDVAPGERPSDMGADSWMDPPPASAESCCDVGEIVFIDTARRQASPPVVAWDGGEWGASWRDMLAPGTGDTAPPRVVFRRLDATAHPSSEFIELAVRGWPAEMAYGNHRFGLVTSTVSGARGAGLFVIDRDGVLRGDARLPDDLEGRAVTRFQPVHGWAVVASGDSGGGRTDAALLVYDESLALVAREPLPPVVYGGFEADPAITAAKSVLVAAVTTPDARTSIRTYAGRGVELVGETIVPSMGGELVATTLRDEVVVAGRSSQRSDAAVRLAIWDPWSRAVAVPPTVVGHATGDQGLGIAADDVGGTVGVCFPTGGSLTSDSSSITFVLFGPDGAPLGAPVVLAAGFRYVASCAVAAAGADAYVVLFWNAAWESVRPSILAVRVGVRR